MSLSFGRRIFARPYRKAWAMIKSCMFAVFLGLFTVPTLAAGAPLASQEALVCLDLTDACYQALAKAGCVEIRVRYEWTHMEYYPMYWACHVRGSEP